MSQETKTPNDLLKKYIQIALTADQNIRNQEIEAVFGNKFNGLTRIQFENVISKLKSRDVSAK